jgi:hypothetical protein
MIKKLGQKILVAYASAQLTASDKKDKKAEKKAKKDKRKEAEREQLASIRCPYCGEHYAGHDIYRRAYRPENLRLSQGDVAIYLSFMTCRRCCERFGIKEWNTDWMQETVRSTFAIQSEKNI